MFAVHNCVRRTEQYCLGLIIALCFSTTCLAEAGETSKPTDLRVRAPGKKQLYRKVIVTTKTKMLKNVSDAGGPPVSPFSIFSLLKSDEGLIETKGHVRVGTSKGKPLGWIGKENVLIWDTRLFLAPHSPLPKRTFTIFEKKSLMGNYYELQKIARNVKVMAPILNRTVFKSEPIYEVAFFSAKVPSRHKPFLPKDDLPSLKDLKLEVVFVVDTTGSMRPSIDMLHGVIQKCAKFFKDMPELKGSVRFGLVQYRDKGDEFVSKVVTPLTDDIKFVAEKVAGLRVAGGGDVAEQVLAGLKTAIEKSGWTKLSSKHIMLLGDAPAHVDSKSTTGGTIADVINLGRKSGRKSHVQMLNESIAFHAILASKNPIAKQQFIEISSNNGDFAGYFKQFDPTKKSSRFDTSAELTQQLLRGFSALQAIREGRFKKPAAPYILKNNGPLAQVFYKLYATSPPEQGISAIGSGWTNAKSSSGKPTATLAILAHKRDLIFFLDDVNYLHRKFKRLTDPSMRIDAGMLLRALQISAARLLSGQSIDQHTNLKQLIDDLSAKSMCMATTVRDLAKMNKEEYTKWVARLQACEARIEMLLRSKERIHVSAGFAPDQELMFLRLVEIP